MKANVVDLRYRMSDVMKALDRNESVSVIYRGKVKGYIRPASSGGKLKVEEDPFFGMDKSAGGTVKEVMDNLRGGRFK